jgi:hypothetical protein
MGLLVVRCWSTVENIFVWQLALATQKMNELWKWVKLGVGKLGWPWVAILASLSTAWLSLEVGVVCVGPDVLVGGALAAGEPVDGLDDVVMLALGASGALDAVDGGGGVDVCGCLCTGDEAGSECGHD